MFGEHAVLHAPDIDGPHLDSPPGARDAHELAVVRPSIDEAADDTVAGDDDVLGGRGHVRQGGEEARPEPAIRLASVGDEEVVVDVVGGHEPVHEVRVVLVEHRHERLDEAMRAGGHLRTPIGSGHLRTPIVVGVSNANPGLS